MKGSSYIICLMFFFPSVSQLQALLMFGARWFLVSGAALCIVNGSASLTLLDANMVPLLPVMRTEKYLQTASDIPWEAKPPPLETTALNIPISFYLSKCIFHQEL